MIIAGCGYTGLRLAKAHARKAGSVHAIVSNKRSRVPLADRGIEAAAWNLDAAEPSPPLPADPVIVYLVPPPSIGSDDPRLSHFLGALTYCPRRIVYVSTTGVYGNHDGGVVDEDTPPNPATDRATRRLAAETLLRRWCSKKKVEWVILRVPGIYGPNRLQLATLASGRPLLRANLAGPGNRIHVDDLVSCLLAAATTGHAGRIYNVGDGDFASNTEFVTEVARQLDRPPPRQADLATVRSEASERRWSFMRESRRVDTTAMREILGVTPRYPQMALGIEASLAD